MTFTNDPPLISSIDLIPDAVEKADLDAPSGSGGKLVIGQAPNITITETSVVADAAERLALDVQEGDVAIQTNVSSSFIFTGGDNIAPNWEVLDFDAVGAIAGEDIAPNDINALGDILGQSIDVVTVNGADTSAASAGEFLTADGSGNLSFSSPQASSQVLRNGSAIEYVALDISNLPAPNASEEVALLTDSDVYVKDITPVGSPFDITSSGVSLDTSISPQDGTPEDIAWNNDGSKLFEVEWDLVYESNLSTPFDISTATFNASYNTQERATTGITFNDDGTRFYEVNRIDYEILQFNLSTAYDLSTAALDTNIPAEATNPEEILWNNTGTRLYELGDRPSKIHQYTVSTPFDIDTASVVTQINTETDEPKGIAWNDDGSRLYEVGQPSDVIVQYSVSSPYDISTATVTDTVATEDGFPTSIAWNNDGTKFYETGSQSIYQFTVQKSGWTTI